MVKKKKKKKKKLKMVKKKKKNKLKMEKKKKKFKKKKKKNLHLHLKKGQKKVKKLMEKMNKLLKKLYNIISIDLLKNQNQNQEIKKFFTLKENELHNYEFFNIYLVFKLINQILFEVHELRQEVLMSLDFTFVAQVEMEFCLCHFLLIYFNLKPFKEEPNIITLFTQANSNYN